METRSLFQMCRRLSPSSHRVIFQRFHPRQFSAFHPSSSPPPASSGTSKPTGESSLLSLSRSLKKESTDSARSSLLSPSSSFYPSARKEHHLSIYSTRRNCHMVLSGPDYFENGRMRRKTLLSLSCGSIGFRKSNRGTYDAAYQLGAYLMNRIKSEGLLREIQNIDLVFRGFGPGREAATKILLGKEGTIIRDMVVRVTDATRLKFGGTRSPKQRRLG